MRQKLIPSRLGKWRNWAGTIERHGIEFCSPVDLDSLCSVVRSAADSGQSIRPVGSTHSFSGVAAPDQLLCDLSRLSGITNIDYIPGGAVVSVLGGTVLRDLGPALWRSGLAMQNRGDIDRQTIAGAISTGTHGTGIGFGSLSTQVVGLRIVTAAGEVLSCSPHERPDVFAAALVGLGLLGVIYEVDLRCDDAYLVRTEGVTMPYRQVIEELDDLLTNDHFEFLRFPSSPDVVAVIRNRVPTETELDQQGPLARSFDTAVSTCGFWLLQRLSDRTPITKDALNSAANAVWGSGRSTIAPPHVAFPSTWHIRFDETEWALPASSGSDVQEPAHEMARALAGPVETRFVAGDDAWLSTTAGESSLYMAFHGTTRGSHPAFDDIQRLMVDAGGRPHWGKWHSLGPGDCHKMYPHLDDFLAVRASLDPSGVFTGHYFRRMFGIT